MRARATAVEAPAHPTAGPLADAEALAAITRPPGEEPLPGGHVGQLSHSLSILRSPRAGFFVALAALFAGGAGILGVALLLHIWTAAHPTRTEGRGWARLVRWMLLPVVLLSFSPTVALLPATMELFASPLLPTVLCGVLMLLGGAAPLIAVEGLWRLHRRLLRAGQARDRLRRSVRVGRLRMGVAALVSAVSIALAGAGVLDAEATVACFGLGAAAEALLGLALVFQLYKASRAVALRKLPDPKEPLEVPGAAALEQETGLRLQPVAGMQVAQGAVAGRPVAVAVDPASDPALLGVTVSVDGLGAAAPGLVLAARGADAPPGVPLPDPILGRLVVARCDEPEVVAPLVGDLHEPLLAVLQGWPGSVVADGEIRLKGTLDLGTGDERLGSQRGVDEAVADALALARALEERVAARG